MTDFERLKSLGGSPKTGAAKIRQALDDIEAALAAGHSREEIIEAMGLGLTLSGFKIALHRVRKERAEKGSGSSRQGQTNSPAATSGQAKEPASQPPLTGSEEAPATPEDNSEKSPQEKLREAMMAKDRATDMFSSFNQPKRPIGGKIK